MKKNNGQARGKRGIKIQIRSNKHEAGRKAWGNKETTKEKGSAHMGEASGGGGKKIEIKKIKVPMA